MELTGGVVARPLAAVLNRAVADFDGGGTQLEGRPAETALAVARLEWLGEQTQPGGGLSTLPESYVFALQRAVREARQILAIAPDATPATLVPALLAASRALVRNDTAAAQAALSGPDFRATSRPVLSRLREPGPFTEAALVLPSLRDEYRLARDEGWAGRRFAPESLDTGVITTPDLTGGTGVR